MDKSSGKRPLALRLVSPEPEAAAPEIESALASSNVSRRTRGALFIGGAVVSLAWLALSAGLGRTQERRAAAGPHPVSGE